MADSSSSITSSTWKEQISVPLQTKDQSNVKTVENRYDDGFGLMSVVYYRTFDDSVIDRFFED